MARGTNRLFRLMQSASDLAGVIEPRRVPTVWQRPAGRLGRSYSEHDERKHRSSRLTHVRYRYGHGLGWLL
jgi:hypothetical protein